MLPGSALPGLDILALINQEYASLFASKSRPLETTKEEFFYKNPSRRWEIKKVDRSEEKSSKKEGES